MEYLSWNSKKDYKIFFFLKNKQALKRLSDKPTYTKKDL